MSSNNKILHITSDEETSQRLKNAGMEGDFLAWQDALFEGPIVNENLTQLSKLRAAYFAKQYQMDVKKVYASFFKRNQVLYKVNTYNEVVLWFDQNLHAQLQFTQLLTWFNRHKLGSLIISVIFPKNKRTIQGIVNIASLPDPHIQQLFSQKTEITTAQFAVCSHFWQALTASNPNSLLTFYQADMSSMPFIKDAIARLLKEFPSQANGLNQTEYLILQAVQKKQNSKEDIFLYVQSKEALPFMSRALLFDKIDFMMNSESALLTESVLENESALQENDSGEINEIIVSQSVKINLTYLAKQILHNWSDWLQVQSLNRWIGGVHLTEGNIWRYNRDARKLTKTYA